MRAMFLLTALLLVGPARADDAEEAYQHWRSEKPQTVQACDEWFGRAPKDCAVGSAEGCLADQAECLRRAMVHALDAYLVPLEAQSPKSFAAEMQLQAAFNRGVESYCKRAFFNAGGMHRSMKVEDCKIAVYRWRAGQAALMKKGEGLGLSGQPHQGPWLLGEGFKSFATQYCALHWQPSWGDRGACLPRALGMLDALYELKDSASAIRSWNSAMSMLVNEALADKSLDRTKLKSAGLLSDDGAFYVDPTDEKATEKLGGRILYDRKGNGQYVRVVELGRAKGLCSGACPTAVLWVYVDDWAVIGRWEPAAAQAEAQDPSVFPLVKVVASNGGAETSWRFDDQASRYLEGPPPAASR